MDVQTLKNEILNGKTINKEEAMFIANAELEEICSAADEIRKAFCSDGFSWKYKTVCGSKMGWAN